MKKKCVTKDEAVPAKGQHTSPCSDCPFSREALKCWLGSSTVEEWVRMAHGETRIECHVFLGAQCAGAAVYRTNVVKHPRDETLLILPGDVTKVFATPFEFMEHHRR